jgi:tyrosine-protein kinase Etk/Wzc
MIGNTLDTDLLGQVAKSQADPQPIPETEVSLIELATVLLRRKKLVLGVTAAATVFSAIVVSLIPPTFKAEATILPPQQQQSSLATLSGALGGLAGASMASSFGLKNPGDLYVGILGSRTIADDLIANFHLEQVYKTKLESSTRKALAKHSSFSSGKDSLITIAVEDHDPKRAADLANAYVDELYKQNSRLAITDASQRRLFFEQALGKEKDALANAEIALKNTQQSTGLFTPSAQAEALIRSGAQLRAEIASREVQLQAMRSYATDENPQTQVVQREIAALRGQLANLQAKAGPGSVFDLSAGKLPDSGLQYIRATRDLKYHEALYELLAKQYEAARIDEAKQAPVLQVVDRAVAPDRKVAPSRAMTVVLSSLFAFIAACAFALFADAILASARKLCDMNADSLPAARIK